MWGCKLNKSQELALLVSFRQATTASLIKIFDLCPKMRKLTLHRGEMRIRLVKNLFSMFLVRLSHHPARFAPSSDWLRLFGIPGPLFQLCIVQSDAGSGRKTASSFFESPTL